MSHATSTEISPDTREWLDQLTVGEMEVDTDTVFARLRREAPLAYIPAIGAWVASTWELCTQIPDDAENFVGAASPVHERVLGVPHVLGAEGDEHRQLRQAIDPPMRPRAFTPRLEEQVRPAAKAQVERLREQGSSAELMADYFEPISVRSVGDVLGFTDVDSETLRRWFHGLSSGMANLEMDADGNFANPAGFAASDAAVAEIKVVVEELAGRDHDGLVAHWLNSAGTEEQPPELAGLYPTLHVILLGGLQEPGHSCGSTFLGLSSRPEQLARVIDDPTLIPKAVGEGLRWTAPIYSTSARLTTRDLELHGQAMRASEVVWVAYGSANHDEAEFTDGLTYDIDRPKHRHLAFGRGRHTCSGAAFSPQVARIAFEELFAAFPTIRLNPDYTPALWGWLFRGPAELHAVW